MQIVDWSVGSSFLGSNFELNFVLLMCWRGGGESKRSGLTLSDDWRWGRDSIVESLGLEEGIVGDICFADFFYALSF